MKNLPPLESYPIERFPELERLALTPCPCCGEKYNARNPMDLVAHCHPDSPVTVSYWDGFLYLTCKTCLKPIVRVSVDKSLL